MLGKILASLQTRFGRSNRGHLKRSQHIHLTNPWHAVAIVPAKPACQACISLKNVRFLAREAPRLPLKGCQNPGGCKCVFRHYADRRAGPRRTNERMSNRSAISAPSVRNVSDNRRSRVGRRASDGQ
jgi:hypothetical protein